MYLIHPSSTELLQFLTGYVTWRCDLDLWHFELGVMSPVVSLHTPPRAVRHYTSFWPR